jgi:hypothetical protein
MDAILLDARVHLALPHKPGGACFESFPSIHTRTKRPAI